MPRTKPPFRADHVGSLLRPPKVLRARESFARLVVSLLHELRRREHGLATLCVGVGQGQAALFAR